MEARNGNEQPTEGSSIKFQHTIIEIRVLSSENVNFAGQYLVQALYRKDASIFEKIISAPNDESKDFLSSLTLSGITAIIL